MWKPSHGKQKNNSVCSYPQPLYAIILQVVVGIVFSLLSKLYAPPKCFNSFFFATNEKKVEWWESKDSRDKNMDYSALFSVSFDPWILFYLWLDSPLPLPPPSGSGKTLSVPATRNLNLSLSSTKRKKLIYVFCNVFSIPDTELFPFCLRSLDVSTMTCYSRYDISTHHFLVSNSHAICIQVKFNIFLVVDNFLITSINLCNHSPLSAFTSIYLSEVS